jgi:copper chaperone CopZ
MTSVHSRTYLVEGMECGHCVSIIASAVRQVDGVTSTTVDRPLGTVTVDGEQFDDQAIKASILEAGYTVRG